MKKNTKKYCLKIITIKLVNYNKKSLEKKNKVKNKREDIPKQ
jgi:hypothetical protein